MLRLSTFCMLLAIAVAQSGYEYNKPGKPFSQGTTPVNNAYSPAPAGFQGSTATPAYRPQGVQGDDYTNTGGSTPSFPPSSSYPSGPNQGYSSPAQKPQSGYSSQTPAGPSFGQGPSGATGVYPGQTGSDYPGQGQNYRGQDQQNYPGQTGSPGQSGEPNGPGYPGQSSQISGNLGQNIAGGPSYSGAPGQPGQISGGPGQVGAPGFGPANAGFGQANAGFGQTNDGFGSDNTGAYEGGDYSAIPGQPDIDYPILTEIPTTSFRCDAQAYPGYYADVETRCQVFHVCANNRTYDFLCPNGTIFSQQVFVCVWWNQFDCNSAPTLYDLNANLYDYSKTGSAAQSGYQGGLNDYSQGQQGPSQYPGSAPQQGPSANYPGSDGSQGPSYPASAATGFPGSAGPQGPSGNYPAPAGVQSAFPGSGSQGPSGTYPSGAPSQSPSSSYAGPASQVPSSYSPAGPQSPSGYPRAGQTAYPVSQGPSSSYLAPTPQAPSGTFSGSGFQGSSSYPRPGQGSSSSYPGSGSPGSPGYTGSTQGSPSVYPESPVTPEYPSSGSSQGQSSKAPGFPGSGGSQGYPSGKPTGPSFSTGGRPQQPNREYLPPRN